MTNVQRSRRQVRLSRALGIALTPKAQRIFEKRPYAPGEHGRDRRRTESDYAVRMREKQRLRAQYGISEKQLRAAYEKATRTAGQTGNAMLTDLETRLDNLVLRAGIARTTAQARQFVVHRHILARDAGFSRSGARAFSRRLNERNPSTPGIGRSVPVTRCSSRSTTVSAGTTTGASKRRDSDGSDRRSAGITPFCAGGMGRTLGLSCGAGRSSRSCHLHCG